MKETVEDDDDDIHIEVRLNLQKPKWEDNYKLQSYYIHLDLLKVFNKTAKKMGKGAKTLIIIDKHLKRNRLRKLLLRNSQKNDIRKVLDPSGRVPFV